jgi:NTP pyrophosphatase (non-canonical NTP hydrolase)
MDKLQDIINKNYDSIVKRGLITPSTNAYQFVDKLFEEVGEVEEIVNEIADKKPTNKMFENLNEEIADVILTALNFAQHFDIDIEDEINKKIKKNYERARDNT